MSDEIDLFIDADGGIQHVYDDAVADLFVEDAVAVRRASHVEPASTVSPGTIGWIANMGPSGGNVLTSDRQGGYKESEPPFLDGWPFQTRAEALAAERAWLDARMREGRL